MNTNENIINKVTLNLHSLSCAYYVSDAVHTSDNHKHRQNISITGLKRCLRFLLVTKNKWVAKRNQRRSSAIQEFIESRLAKQMKEDYSDRELQLVQSVKGLNLRG